MSRLTGDLINEIPSVCDHYPVRMCKYHQDQDYVFESCAKCKEIRAYNINTAETFTVHKGSKIIRMCEGPAGSLLVVDNNGGIWKLHWDRKTQDQTQPVFIQYYPRRTGKSPLKFCYAECHDIFMLIMKDTEEEDYEIIAVKLGSESIVWRLYGPVDGYVIKPESITCDIDGNAYVGDRATNRILKIDGLTGEILSILLFELEEIRIQSIRWTNTEPNLTLLEGKLISTYFVPK